MKTVWALCYNIVVLPLTYLLFRFGGLFSDKIKRAIQGRKGLFQRLQEEIIRLPENKTRIWFHTASYGEFEQAKPVLSALKENDQQVSIIVSLFSPSAYENIAKFPAVDIITYLPFDSYWNAEKYISLIDPKVAVIVRHDIWPNHLWRAKKEGIPVILFDATLRPDSSRFYPIVRNFSKTIYNTFDDILAASHKDLERLKKLYSKHDHLQAVGDTKYDQAMKRSQEVEKLEAVIDLDAFDGKRVLVAGQTHLSDERHIIPAFKKLSAQIDNLIMILAPHEPTSENITSCEAALGALKLSYLRLSQYRKHQTNVDFQILIVDSMGVLANLYRFAEVVFMGGSFRPGIHNVLEPSVYGVPILFGPKIQVSTEAQELVTRKGAFIVHNADEIYEKLYAYFRNETERKQVGHITYELVMENIGATRKVVECIEKYL